MAQVFWGFLLGVVVCIGLNRWATQGGAFELRRLGNHQIVDGFYLKPSRQSYAIYQSQDGIWISNYGRHWLWRDGKLESWDSGTLTTPTAGE